MKIFTSILINSLFLCVSASAFADSQKIISKHIGGGFAPMEHSYSKSCEIWTDKIVTKLFVSGVYSIEVSSLELQNMDAIIELTDASLAGEILIGNEPPTDIGMTTYLVWKDNENSYLLAEKWSQSNYRKNSAVESDQLIRYLDVVCKR